MESDAAEMNSLITQCPNCQTAFRINATQLSAAEGNVRCGACLKIFMAEENLLDIGPGDTALFDDVETDLESDTEPDTDSDTDLDSNTDSDSDTDTDTDFESGTEEEFTAAQDPTPESEHGFYIDTEDEPELLQEPEPKEPDEPSSNWELIDESPEPEQEQEQEQEQEPEPDVEAEYEIAYDAESITEYEIETDLPHQQQMLLDDDFAGMSDGRTEPSLFAARRAALHADLHDEEDTERFSDDNRAALRSVDAPVELNSHFRLKVSAIRLAGQGFLLVLLAACLALQLVWFNRDTLSMQAEWRPRLDMLCSVFGCTVPPQRDLTAIVSESLEVRSHPQERGALLVNLSFSNQAAFAQPFPALTLRFTDTQQQVIASRRFLPGEYLQEDLRTMSLMPPGTSVQAQLDIVDPGTNAINYEVLLGNLD